MKQRRSALRSAAGRYITHRKRFPSRCPSCKGRGKRVQRRGRRASWVDCKPCVGKGVWLSKKDYRAVYFDMRTPAFRALPEIKETLGKQYDLARHGKPWPLHIIRYLIHDWAMVDATHGVAWLRYNGAKVATATYWIYAPKAKGGRSQWFLYDARSDGAWPDDAGGATPAGAATRGGAGDDEEPLDSGHGALVRAAVARARITFRVVESVVHGDTLRLRLLPGSDRTDRAPYERVGPDAVRLVRALFTADAPWRRIEAEWRDHFKDSYGQVALRPRWISALSKVEHERAGWDGRTLEEQIAVLAHTEVRHEGWTPLRQGRGASEPTPVEPTPAPVAPTPVAPTPVAPTPVRPAPTPQRPPPATAPTTDELPALTAKARRAAKSGLAKIQTQLAAATAAFNDGVLAHKGGAMDLWQEKLSEARAHLGEIQDIWWESIVVNMPGTDESEQDAVANEHYGEVWDDVTKLKSMVNKMSRL